MGRTLEQIARQLPGTDIRPRVGKVSRIPAAGRKDGEESRAQKA
jgi:hypothetical protein